MASQVHGPILSLMLAVPDAPSAFEWYKQALGATELWSLGSVVGLEVEGAPFFLAEPANNGWESPKKIGTTTVRVELFCDDPDAVIARAWRQAQPAVSTISRITKRPGESIGKAGSSIRLGTSGSSAINLH